MRKCSLERPGAPGRARSSREQSDASRRGRSDIGKCSSEYPDAPRRRRGDRRRASSGHSDASRCGRNDMREWLLVRSDARGDQGRWHRRRDARYRGSTDWRMDWSRRRPKLPRRALYRHGRSGAYPLRAATTAPAITWAGSPIRGPGRPAELITDVRTPKALARTRRNRRLDIALACEQQTAATQQPTHAGPVHDSITSSARAAAIGLVRGSDGTLNEVAQRPHWHCRPVDHLYPAARKDGVGFLEQPHVLFYIVTLLKKGLRVPLAALRAKKVTTVDVDRAGQTGNRVRY
jgi:hypothetical protein